MEAFINYSGSKWEWSISCSLWFISKGKISLVARCVWRAVGPQSVLPCWCALPFPSCWSRLTIVLWSFTTRKATEIEREWTHRTVEIAPLWLFSTMAGSTNKTVHDIFQSMEYGPAAASSTATAQVKWSLEISTRHTFRCININGC